MRKNKIVAFFVACMLVLGIFPSNVLASTECTVPGCISEKLYWQTEIGSSNRTYLYITIGTRGDISTYENYDIDVVSVCPHGTYARPFNVRMLDNYDSWLMGIEQDCVVNYHGKQLETKIMNVYPYKKFSDTTGYDWYEECVSFVQMRGFMSGLNETQFGPTVDLSRAQFAVALYRMAGEPDVEYHNEFEDVQDNTWYTDAAAWCSQNGIITGYTNTGLFGPADVTTREQAITILYRFANYKGYDTSQRASLDTYPDGGTVSEFAKTAMEWAVAKRIIVGNNGRLDPQGTLQRAQAATVIARFADWYMETDQFSVEE